MMDHAIQTCPTDVVAAPPERIWGLLTRPEKMSEWSGAKLIDGPDRALVVGDRVVVSPGFGLKVLLEVRGMEALRQLVLNVHLPLGVANYEVIQISPLNDARCRVTFN